MYFDLIDLFGISHEYGVDNLAVHVDDQFDGIVDHFDIHMMDMTILYTCFFLCRAFR